MTLPLALMAAVAACTQASDAPAQASANTPAKAAPCPKPSDSDWREVATADDRTRLRSVRDAWTAGLSQARGHDDGAIAANPALFDPDRVQAARLPPAGTYRCRVFKLGAQGSYGLPFVAYPAFTCRVDQAGKLLRFAKLTGSQRPVGTIYPDGDARGVFLGTLVLGDERAPLRYGQDRERDMVGAVEQIGPQRWRLVLPSPAFESLIDVVELVPAG